MDSKYKFGNINISEDQYNDLTKIATLGSMGLLPGNSGNELLTNVLLAKPKKQSILEQYIQGMQPSNQSVLGINNLAATPKNYGARKKTVTELYMQGMDPKQILNSLNYDQAGQQIDDYTPGEISSYITPLQDTTQEEGRFGFGTGKGELFGEGGALGPTSIPRQIANLGIGGITSGIINPAAAVVQSIGGTIGDVLGGKTLEESLANPERAIQNQRGLFGKGSILDPEGNVATLMSQEEYMKDPTLGGLKSAADILSFAPIGGGAAKNIAGQIANPLLRAGVSTAVPAAISSGLSGFGTSKRGEEIGNALQNSILGGGIGFGLGVGGKLIQSAFNKTSRSILGQLDQNIKDLKNSHIKKGTDKTMIKNYFGDKTNARVNYITGELTGDEQKTAMIELLKKISPKDKYYEATKTAAKLVGIDPDDVIPMAGKKTVTSEIERLAVEGGLDPTLDVYGVPKLEGNAIERAGKNLGATSGLGIKASGKTTPAVIQDLANDRAVIITAIDNINKNTASNIPYSPEGFNRLFNGIEAADIVGKSGFNGISQKELMDKTVKALTRDAIFSGWDKSTATIKANQVLGNLLGFDAPLDQIMTGSRVIPANQLNQLAKAAFKASNNLLKNAAAGVGVNAEDKAILDVVDSVTRGILRENVTGYQGLNNLWRALYRQAGNVRDVSTPIQSVSQAGVLSPVKAITQQGGRLAGSVLRQAGQGFPVIGDITKNISRKIGDRMLNLSSLENIISNPQAMEAANTAARLLPLGLLNNTQNVNTAPNTDYSYLPTYNTAPNYEDNMQTINNNNFKNVLAMAVLSGEIEPAVANTAISLLGLDAKGKTDTTKIDAAEKTLLQLRDMYNNIGYSGEGVLARLGGGIRSLAGGWGLESDVSSYQKLRESIKSQLARALGETGTLSDSDKKDVIESVPNIGDTPQEAENKWNFIFTVLNQTRNSMGSNINDNGALLFSGY